MASARNRSWRGTAILFAPSRRRRRVHDPGHPLYLPLRLLHILGAMAFVGGLGLALWWKLQADRSGDPAFAARVHGRLRRMDGQIIGPAALLTFAAGYAMVRFLGGRIAHHGFVLWGLIGMFLALALWYFGMRRLSDQLEDEADAALANRQPLSRDYARKSAAWVASAGGAVALVLVVVVLMVFRLPAP